MYYKLTKDTHLDKIFISNNARTTPLIEKTMTNSTSSSANSSTIGNLPMSVQLLKILDFIPVVSALSNIITYIAKKALQFLEKPGSIVQYSLLKQFITKKETKSNLLLSIPFLNIYVAYQLYKPTTKAASPLSPAKKETGTLKRLENFLNSYKAERDQLLTELYLANQEQADQLEKRTTSLGVFLNELAKSNNVSEETLHSKRQELVNRPIIVILRVIFDALHQHEMARVVEAPSQVKPFETLLPKEKEVDDQLIEKMAELLFIGFKSPSLSFPLINPNSSIHQEIFEKWEKLASEAKS